jgi:hypothetical protein
MSLIQSIYSVYKREYFPLTRADLNVTLYNTNSSYLLYRFRLGFTTLNVELGGRNIIHNFVTAAKDLKHTHTSSLIATDSMNKDRNSLIPWMPF